MIKNFISINLCYLYLISSYPSSISHHPTWSIYFLYSLICIYLIITCIYLSLSMETIHPIHSTHIYLSMIYLTSSNSSMIHLSNYASTYLISHLSISRFPSKSIHSSRPIHPWDYHPICSIYLDSLIPTLHPILIIHSNHLYIYWCYL